MTDGGRSAGERRRLVIWLAAAAALITVGVAAMAWSLGGVAPGGAARTSPVEPGWVRLPDPPLSPRQSATAVSAAGVILLIGGDEAPPCPPNADCAAPASPLRDGARYDPASGTWTTIAPAPVPIGLAEVAVVDGRAYLWVMPAAGGAGPAFLEYDVSADAWAALPMPPVLPGASVRLAATADSVIAYPGSHEQGDRVDQVFDVNSGTWANLPADPLGPSYDRSIVVVDGRVVAISAELVPNPGQRPPVYRAAVLDPGGAEWRRLADAPIVGNDPTWFAVGGLALNPALGGADGGQVNGWGRVFPFGGMLDVDGEAWIDLPGPPPNGGSFAGPPVAGQRFVVNRQSWVLDVDELAWQPVGAPDGGPESGAAAAWAGDRLVLYGGVRFDGQQGSLLGGAWLWTSGRP